MFSSLAQYMMATFVPGASQIAKVFSASHKIREEMENTVEFLASSDKKNANVLECVLWKSMLVSLITCLIEC